MARPVTKVHDKYKDMLEEWRSNQLSRCTVTMPVEELATLIDEFESLKYRYVSLQMRGTYGFRDNY